MIPEPIVILANGDFPYHKEPLLILEKSGTIICCDGSVNNLVKNGMEPNYILGDMDSIDENLKGKYRERVIELPDQNENDLRKAINWAQDKGAKKGTILGWDGDNEVCTPYENCVLIMPNKLKGKGHSAVRFGKFIE